MHPLDVPELGSWVEHLFAFIDGAFFFLSHRFGKPFAFRFVAFLLSGKFLTLVTKETLALVNGQVSKDDFRASWALLSISLRRLKLNFINTKFKLNRGKGR